MTKNKMGNLNTHRPSCVQAAKVPLSVTHQTAKIITVHIKLNADLLSAFT